jgi:hypothetical protein
MSHWLEKVLLLLRSPTSDLKALAKLAGDDPRIFYRGIELGDLETEGQDLTGMEFGDVEVDPGANDNYRPEPYKVAAAIAKTARQEERVSLVLDLILRDRTRGFKVLMEYQSVKAKFESHALQEIRSAFSDPSTSNDQLIAASLVSKFFSFTYPMNRGRLLYFLAKNLAKYPIVNEAIRVCLRKTASMFVDEYRSRIDQLLTEGK